MNYGEFDALIFDCDGTLADSMPVHYLAWSETLARYELEIGEDHFYSMGGFPSWVVVDHIYNMAGRKVTDAEARRISDEKEETFWHRLSEIEPIHTVVEVVNQYHGTKPMAVATGGIHTICRAILSHISILDKFPVIVTSEDVPRGKPYPDIYLEAARQLGVDPKRCLAFEDAEPGIVSATAAGMKVFDVRTVHTPKRHTRPPISA
jgi:beta-phosphoglucomutase family hydrolase